jgi:D-aminopeptidase
MSRARLRDLGITIGTLPPGPHNAITDVPDVLVGHTTLIYDQPRVARTGVTVVVPRAGQIWKDNAFAAYHTFNGTGEMTGVHWLTESGLLCYPVAITNTGAVGAVHQAMAAYGREKALVFYAALPVVAETLDYWLNDMGGHHVQKEHLYQALDEAKSGPVAEGNVGGGTGMICYDFKGGIGTASRVVTTESGTFTVGALVQANHGDRADFRVDGVPVGREIGEARVPFPWTQSQQAGSIIIVVATDAPLIPVQCQRLAKRATVGLARTGGMGYNASGDIFLALATGNHFPGDARQPYDLRMLPHHHLNGFFQGVAEAVEEAILNALTAAETMTGRDGHTAHALPLDDLQQVMARYRS